ncbi:MAG: hypothetical protein HUK13_03185 [Muribaculaceae bacterium]|nr:hypothetical protein [Muribaculaceae bacterium]
MKKFIAMMVVAVMTVALAVNACAGIDHAYTTGKAIVENDTTNNKKGAFNVTVKSVDFRKDLLRVTCVLQGRPNTSQRIDGVRLYVSGKKYYEATDIDGVDLKRYFQWEEDGKITVEIDFKATYLSLKRFDLVFETPLGTYRYQVKHL